jgi:hypothetical protein
MYPRKNTGRFWNSKLCSADSKTHGKRQKGKHSTSLPPTHLKIKIETEENYFSICCNVCFKTDTHTASNKNILTWFTRKFESCFILSNCTPEPEHINTIWDFPWRSRFVPLSCRLWHHISWSVSTDVYSRYSRYRRNMPPNSEAVQQLRSMK